MSPEDGRLAIPLRANGLPIFSFLPSVGASLDYLARIFLYRPIGIGKELDLSPRFKFAWLPSVLHVMSIDICLLGFALFSLFNSFRWRCLTRDISLSVRFVALYNSYSF